MRLMTLNHIPGTSTPHTVTVDQETGTSGKSIFTVKVDGYTEKSTLDPYEAVRIALDKGLVEV